MVNVKVCNWSVAMLLTGLSVATTASATDEYQICRDVYRHVVSAAVRAEYPEDSPAFHAREATRRLDNMRIQARINECAQHRLATGYEVNRRATACILKTETFEDIEKCGKFPVVRK